MEKKKLTKPPSLQDVKSEMEYSGAYKHIFPETFKLLDILLTLPVGQLLLNGLLAKLS